MPFVDPAFVVPLELDGGWCRLRPLAVGDNVADFAAWHGSIDHIHATPGFEGRPWPLEDYTLEQNHHDLAEHEADFAERQGFTYTVLDPSGEVIGCLYVYPPVDGAPEGTDASVRSWVRADHAARDADLYRLVTGWLADVWPFRAVDYAPRV